MSLVWSHLGRQKDMASLVGIVTQPTTDQVFIVAIDVGRVPKSFAYDNGMAKT